MKVRLKTNFDTGLGADEIECQEGNTLRTVLNNISRRIGFNIIDPRHDEVDSFVEVRVNNREHFLYPQQLDSPLSEGDEVEIMLTMFGGG